MQNEDIKSKCMIVKELICQKKYDDASMVIRNLMADYPNNPEPHNLLGILLEKTGNHILAIKHFNISWVLDPCYSPANKNLSNFTNLKYSTDFIFDDKECVKEKKKYQIVYDDKHIGHLEKIMI